MEAGDPARFTTEALSELVATGGGRVGDGVIDVVDEDLEGTPQAGQPWHDLPPGRYRVVGIDGTVLDCVFEGPVP